MRRSHTWPGHANPTGDGDNVRRRTSAALQTDSLLRPLARRALSTLRPFFVAIRARNPCVLLRLITLGW